MFTDTMKQMAIAYSTVQQKLVNNLTKETPFLKTIPYQTATHSMMNQYENVDQVDGADFKELGAPFKKMNVSTDIIKEDLGILGGLIEINEEKLEALMNMPPEQAISKYFAKRSPIVLNEAGKKTEKHLIYKHILPAILKYNRGMTKNEGTIIDAGGSNNSNWSILAIRQELGKNCGILAPSGQNKDELLCMEWINGGQRHAISDGTIGYAATWSAKLGYQMASLCHMGAIVNIDPDNNKNATAEMINDLLDRIEADASDTVLIMNRGMRSRLYGLKKDQLTTNIEDKDLNLIFDRFNGVTLLGLTTMLRGSEGNIEVPY